MYVKDMLVVLIDETRASDESMRTYVSDDGESVDWLAAASSASSRPVKKKVEFRHCQRLLEDAPPSIAVTQEPSD